MKSEITNTTKSNEVFGVKKEMLPDSGSLNVQILSRKTTKNIKDSGSNVQKRRNNTIDSIIHEGKKKKKSTVVYFPKPVEFNDFEEDTSSSVSGRPVSSWTHRNMMQFVERLPRQVRQTTTVLGEDEPTTKLNFKYMKTGRLLELANRVFGFHGWRTGLVKPVEVVHYEVKFRKSPSKPLPVTYTDNYFEKLDDLIKREDDVERLATIYSHEGMDNGVQNPCKDALENGPEEQHNKQLYYTISSIATVSLSFNDGTVIESQGTSTVVEIPSKAAAFSRAKKEAISNAMKNCFAQIPQYIHEDNSRVIQ